MTTRRDFLTALAATAAAGALPHGARALEAEGTKVGAVFALKNQSRGAERNILDMTTAEVFERMRANFDGPAFEPRMNRLFYFVRHASEPGPAVEIWENGTPGPCGHTAFRIRYLPHSSWVVIDASLPSPWYCVCGEEVVPAPRCETCEGKDFVRAYTEAWAAAAVSFFTP